jgi:hypothetical protein
MGVTSCTSLQTNRSFSMFRRSQPIAVLELTGEVRLRRESAAQRDVPNGRGRMDGIGQQSMRQGQALPPDPLRHAAFVCREHPIEVAKRHRHVACDGLCVKFRGCEVLGDEALRPQQVARICWSIDCTSSRSGFSMKPRIRSRSGWISICPARRLPSILSSDEGAGPSPDSNSSSTLMSIINCRIGWVNPYR